MKAITLREFGGPEVLKLEEIPAPGPGEIPVKVHAVSVNVTLDIAVRIEWALQEAHKGGVRPPVIAKILPLSGAAEAHRLIEARAVSGKLLLDPTRT